MATLSQSESSRLYSWWWDSHISPKNSKWLQENLTDMDAKVKAMIKLIEEDADSFARRAEMYYKKRPELIKLVEEFYRAYRALAERYDYATGELRHAHRKMAEAFPNHQVPFVLSEDSPSINGSGPHTPEMPPPGPALLDPDYLHKDALGLSASDAEISKKTLDKLHELFGLAENSNFAEKEVRKLLDLDNEEREGSLHDEVGKAESEVKNLKKALAKLEAEKELIFIQQKECFERISVLENKIAVTEEEARLLKNRANTAETEVQKLEESLNKLKEEKEAAALAYEQCLEKISMLEKEIFCAREELKRLNSEILVGATKSKSAEENCAVLENLNRSLRLEAENLIKKIALKDQELAEKHGELEKLQIRAREENSRYVQVEATLQNLEISQSRSQEELKNGLQMLRDMEICKHGLEEELRRVKDENWTLNELNSSSNISIRNLQTEILSLRKMKEKLTEELAVQLAQSNSLQKEIFCLKEEIECLNRSYRALMAEVKSLGLDPDSFGSSVKDLQDENSKLKQICENEREEKEVLFKKLEEMEELIEKNAALQSSLSEENGEKSALVAEKAVLLSQLQIITKNMQHLLERNNFLENSLSGANVELAGLRSKSKSLEELSQVLDNEKSNLITERSTLVLQLENVEQRLGNLETRFMEFEGKYVGLEKEKESTHSHVEELKACLGAEKKERESLTLWSETRLASLQNHINLLEEENRWRKKEFQEELDKAVISQFEIFILQKFIQDMEAKNSSILMEFHKQVEEVKFSEKLITELESENLEQQVEMEFLLVEIERLRLGIYQVFKALETRANSGSEEKIENEQIFVDRILGNIEKTKGSLSKYEEDKQKVLVENLVILTVLNQMQNENKELVELNRQLRSEMSKGNQRAKVLEAEVESLYVKQGDVQKAYAELQEEHSNVLEENRSMLRQFADLKVEKCLVEEENKAIFLETFSLGTLSTFFKSFATENAVELKLLSEDLHNLHGVNTELQEEVMILREKVESNETENLLLKDSRNRMEKELFEVKVSNEKLEEENGSGKYLLRQKEKELSEAEKRLEETENSNSELCETVERLKRESEESKLMRENSELQIAKLSEDNVNQRKEIQFLREVNGNLESELGMLHEEIEERRIREENLSLELRERSNEFQIWEAEAENFYFDLQISTVREVVFEDKVKELGGVCERLEDESDSKTREIEEVKEKVGLKESEIGGLKAQLLAYAPLVVSLRENLASLERNTLSLTKLIAAENRKPKDKELAVHLHEKNCQEPMEDQIYPLPRGISDLRNLQYRIKEVEKVVVEQKNRLAMKEIEEMKFNCNPVRVKGNQNEDTGLWDNPRDDLKLRKIKSKKLEPKNGILMKDIPLDQTGTRTHGGVDYQTLESIGSEIVYHQFENEEDQSSDLQIEKELGVDKLQVPESTNKGKILQRLQSNSQRLSSLQTNVQELKRKLEANKNGKNFGTVKEKLQEVEESVAQVLGFHGLLKKNVEESASCSNGDSSTEVVNNLNAQKGFERIVLLQLEVEKIRCMMMKMEEDEKKSKGKSRTKIVLRSLNLYNGRRSSNGRRKKGCFSGCFRPSSSNGEGNSHM